jgi:hypothetical protein
MLRKLLICGMLAGACGGVLATGFVEVVGEPAVDRAIRYEDAHHERAAGTMRREAPAPVSRGVQKTVGLLTAAVVYGLTLGGIFALVFAVAYGRVARTGPRATAYALAAGAFAVVYLVPFLKYPASPPGTTDPATIGRRTALYLTMIAISVSAAIAAARLRPLLARRLDGHTAGIAASLASIAIVVAGGFALPSVREIPKDFPAVTLWRFREASVGMQIVLWASIALVFGAGAPRALAGGAIVPRRRARRMSAPRAGSEL